MNVVDVLLLRRVRGRRRFARRRRARLMRGRGRGAVTIRSVPLRRLLLHRAVVGRRRKLQLRVEHAIRQPVAVGVRVGRGGNGTGAKGGGAAHGRTAVSRLHEGGVAEARRGRVVVIVARRNVNLISGIFGPKLQNDKMLINSNSRIEV